MATGQGNRNQRGATTSHSCLSLHRNCWLTRNCFLRPGRSSVPSVMIGARAIGDAAIRPTSFRPPPPWGQVRRRSASGKQRTSSVSPWPQFKLRACRAGWLSRRRPCAVTNFLSRQLARAGTCWQTCDQSAEQRLRRLSGTFIPQGPGRVQTAVRPSMSPSAK
jgi:hypothetical protein